MHAVPRFQAKGFKRDPAEFRVNPDQFGYPSGFACDIAQLLGFNMGLFFFAGEWLQLRDVCSFFICQILRPNFPEHWCACESRQFLHLCIFIKMSNIIIYMAKSPSKVCWCGRHGQRAIDRANSYPIRMGSQRCTGMRVYNLIHSILAEPIGTSIFSQAVMNGTTGKFSPQSFPRQEFRTENH